LLLDPAAARRRCSLGVVRDGAESGDESHSLVDPQGDVRERARLHGRLSSIDRAAIDADGSTDSVAASRFHRVASLRFGSGWGGDRSATDQLCRLVCLGEMVTSSAGIYKRVFVWMDRMGRDWTGRDDPIF
jgi:hypothetical protein